MSTEYRKADCQSTKNVMGDKPVDPQSGPGGTSLGFKTDENFSYLGHFKSEKFLREGHNTVPQRSIPMLQSPFGAAPRRTAQLAGTALDTAGRGMASRAIRSGDMAAAAERPVLAAKLAARAAGLGGAERRALVSSARLDPNSRMMERRARRMA